MTWLKRAIFLSAFTPGGNGAQPFFRIDAEKAQGFLEDLANRLNRVCIQEEDLFRGTMTDSVQEIKEETCKTGGKIDELGEKVDRIEKFIVAMPELHLGLDLYPNRSILGIISLTTDAHI